MKALTIRPGKLTLAQLRDVYQHPVTLTLDDNAYAPIQQSVACVERIVEENRTTYGIQYRVWPAGFDASPDDLENRSVRSCCRTPPARGRADRRQPGAPDHGAERSTCRAASPAFVWEVIQALIASQRQFIAYSAEGLGRRLRRPGTAGAHEPGAAGRRPGAIRANGCRRPALAKAGLKPLTLAAKEGLALNGTQVSAAFALRGLFDAEDLFAAATVAGSLTVEAALGSRSPFDARIHEVRGQRGQIDAALAYRHLLGAQESPTRIATAKKCRIAALRCQQVDGRLPDADPPGRRGAGSETTPSRINPLVFAEQGDVLSGGNFHAEPVAMAADNLALAFAEIGSLSERRISLMMDKHMSQLPPFLVENGGVNSGFMIAQVTAAALASETKRWRTRRASTAFRPPPTRRPRFHGAGRQSPPVDHGGQRCAAFWRSNGWRLPGPGFPQRPEDLGRSGAGAPSAARACQFLRQDRFLRPDIEAASQLLAAGHLTSLLPAALLARHNHHTLNHAVYFCPAGCVPPGAGSACLFGKHLTGSNMRNETTQLRRGLNARHIRFMARLGDRHRPVLRLRRRHPAGRPGRAAGHLVGEAQRCSW